MEFIYVLPMRPPRCVTLKGDDWKKINMRDREKLQIGFMLYSIFEPEKKEYQNA